MEKKKTDLKEILSFLLILAGSAILAINMNTFVEQGGLVPGGFSGLSKLIQRVALTFFGLKIPFTLLNVFFNAIPAMLAYRFVGKKFTILSCISIVVVSVLVDQLPVTPITGDILLISVFGVCALRLLWLFTVVPAYHTIETVEMSYPITWVVTSASIFIYYRFGKWLKPATT